MNVFIKIRRLLLRKNTIHPSVLSMLMNITLRPINVIAPSYDIRGATLQCSGSFDDVMTKRAV